MTKPSRFPKYRTKMTLWQPLFDSCGAYLLTRKFTVYTIQKRAVGDSWYFWYAGASADVGGRESELFETATEAKAYAYMRVRKLAAAIYDTVKDLAPYAKKKGEHDGK